MAPIRWEDLSPPQKKWLTEMDFRHGTMSQTFKPMSDSTVYGLYHDVTARSVVYLHHHESIDNIISTCVHETLHHCIVGSGGIDDEQEHDLIRLVMWAPEMFYSGKDA